MTILGPRARASSTTYPSCCKEIPSNNEQNAHQENRIISKKTDAKASTRFSIPAQETNRLKRLKYPPEHLTLYPIQGGFVPPKVIEPGCLYRCLRFGVYSTITKTRLRNIHNREFHFHDAVCHLLATQEKPFPYQPISYQAHSNRDELEALFEPVAQQPSE